MLHACKPKWEGKNKFFARSARNIVPTPAIKILLQLLNTTSEDNKKKAYHKTLTLKILKPLAPILMNIFILSAQKMSKTNLVSIELFLASRILQLHAPPLLWSATDC